MSISEELPLKTSRGKCSEATRQISAQFRWAGFRNSVIAYYTGSSFRPQSSRAAQNPGFSHGPAGRAPKAEGRRRHTDLPDEVLVVLLCLLRHRQPLAGPRSPTGSGGWTAVLLRATLGSNRWPLPCQQGRPASCPRTEAQMRPWMYTGDPIDRRAAGIPRSEHQGRSGPVVQLICRCLLVKRAWVGRSPRWVRGDRPVLLCGVFDLGQRVWCDARSG